MKGGGYVLMSVKFKIKVNKFPEMQAKIKDLNGKTINVGLTGENAWLGGIHEYGCKIRITPKMRAWLHNNGLHVKESTQYITIPERSFLRGGFDNCKDEVANKAAMVVPLVLNGEMNEDTAINLIGTLFRDRIKDYTVSLNSPPNHPFTIEHKNSSNPLVDTGDLVNSISYEVE